MRNYVKKPGSNKKPNGYWKNNKEKCIEEARKYESIAEWQKKSPGSICVAYRHKWISECTEHMRNSKKKRGFTEEDSRNAVRKNIDLKTRLKKEREIISFLGLA